MTISGITAKAQALTPVFGQDEGSEVPTSRKVIAGVAAVGLTAVAATFGGLAVVAAAGSLAGVVVGGSLALTGVIGTVRLAVGGTMVAYGMVQMAREEEPLARNQAIVFVGSCIAIGVVGTGLLYAGKKVADAASSVSR